MRTEAENQKIDELARALLQRRGIAPEQANYEQAAQAFEIAAEALDAGETTVAGMLARGALGDESPEPSTTKLLSRFAADGRFIRDLTLSEQDLLEAAIAAEQAVLRRDPVGVIAAEADACPDCGKGWLDCTC